MAVIPQCLRFGQVTCCRCGLQLLSYYYAWLYDVAAAGDDQRYANFTRRTMRRTNTNGMRFHPPNSVELAVSTHVYIA